MPSRLPTCSLTRANEGERERGVNNDDSRMIYVISHLKGARENDVKISDKAARSAGIS